MKTYSEMIKYHTFEERFNYLKLDGIVGSDTFGFNRYANQALYRSREWKKTRDLIVTRDYGCDLGIKGLQIYGNILIHHMNPITLEQIMERDPFIFDPDNLICVSHKTHNAIHYGTDSPMIEFKDRTIGDTKLW